MKATDANHYTTSEFLNLLLFHSPSSHYTTSKQFEKDHPSSKTWTFSSRECEVLHKSALKSKPLCMHITHKKRKSSHIRHHGSFCSKVKEILSSIIEAVKCYSVHISELPTCINQIIKLYIRYLPLWFPRRGISCKDECVDEEEILVADIKDPLQAAPLQPCPVIFGNVYIKHYYTRSTVTRSSQLVLLNMQHKY